MAPAMKKSVQLDSPYKYLGKHDKNVLAEISSDLRKIKLGHPYHAKNQQGLSEDYNQQNAFLFNKLEEEGPPTKDSKQQDLRVNSIPQKDGIKINPKEQSKENFQRNPGALNVPDGNIENSKEKKDLNSSPGGALNPKQPFDDEMLPTGGNTLNNPNNQQQDLDKLMIIEYKDDLTLDLLKPKDFNDTGEESEGTETDIEEMPKHGIYKPDIDLEKLLIIEYKDELTPDNPKAGKDPFTEKKSENPETEIEEMPKPGINTPDTDLDKMLIIEYKDELIIPQSPNAGKGVVAEKKSENAVTGMENMLKTGIYTPALELDKMLIIEYNDELTPDNPKTQDYTGKDLVTEEETKNPETVMEEMPKSGIHTTDIDLDKLLIMEYKDELTLQSPNTRKGVIAEEKSENAKTGKENMSKKVVHATDTDLDKMLIIEYKDEPTPQSHNTGNGVLAEKKTENHETGMEGILKTGKHKPDIDLNEPDIDLDKIYIIESKDEITPQSPNIGKGVVTEKKTENHETGMEGMLKTGKHQPDIALDKMYIVESKDGVIQPSAETEMNRQNRRLEPKLFQKPHYKQLKDTTGGTGFKYEVTGGSTRDLADALNVHARSSQARKRLDKIYAMDNGQKV